MDGSWYRGIETEDRRRKFLMRFKDRYKNYIQTQQDYVSRKWNTVFTTHKLLVSLQCLFRYLLLETLLLMFRLSYKKNQILCLNGNIAESLILDINFTQYFSFRLNDIWNNLPIITGRLFIDPFRFGCVSISIPFNCTFDQYSCFSVGD